MQIECWFTYFMEDSPIEMPERQAYDVYIIFFLISKKIILKKHKKTKTTQRIQRGEQKRKKEKKRKKQEHKETNKD